MVDTISIYETAKWLAEMAGTDGEITPKERKILKSFAETYGVDFSKLARMSYAISGANEQEVQCTCGRSGDRHCHCCESTQEQPSVYDKIDEREFLNQLNIWD